MKKLLVLLALLSQPAWANTCQVSTNTKMIGEHKVGEIQNLVKNKSYRRCEVAFTVDVDGETHKVKWAHDGFSDPEILCRVAIKMGMGELYARLPGVFKTESETICRFRTAS